MLVDVGVAGGAGHGLAEGLEFGHGALDAGGLGVVGCAAGPQAGDGLKGEEQSMQADRHEWACFAAHQAVEKALKGLNLALGQQAWGHTLTRLWAVLPPQDWQPAPPEGLENRLRLLDGFPIPTRYPDSYPEGTSGEHFGRLQSEQALLHARAITQWIRTALASRR